jgi:hypothetical protein
MRKMQSNAVVACRIPAENKWRGDDDRHDDDDSSPVKDERLLYELYFIMLRLKDAKLIYTVPVFTTLVAWN